MHFFNSRLVFLRKKRQAVRDTLAEGEVRVIAGDVLINKIQYQGPIKKAFTQPVLLDVQLSPNQDVSLTFNTNYPAQIYVYGGATVLLAMRELGCYSEGDLLQISAGSAGVQCLVLSGRPIEEPIVQYGPFVMNTKAEIEQAVQDFSDPDYLQSIL